MEIKDKVAWVTDSFGVYWTTPVNGKIKPKKTLNLKKVKGK